jgi:16S rRNA (cytosine1402-N4)-methyltransferase
MDLYHIPVMLHESVQGLNIKPGGDYVDATFGGGGHAREIWNKLKDGRLFAFDQDSDAAVNAIRNKRFVFIRHNFRFLKNFLAYYKVKQVDGILADLGISSHDLDTKGRGFSFRFDEPLDMRMNRDASKDAAFVIQTYSQEELQRIFREYGEINNARKLAVILTKARSEKRIDTVEQFRKTIAPCIPQNQENKYLAKVFQAIRIEVNDEMSALREFLVASQDVLKSGARLVIITYHSLEDRLVKNFMKSGNPEGRIEKDFYGNVHVPFRIINHKVITPGETELKENPRSRSAKLRIAEKK